MLCSLKLWRHLTNLDVFGSIVRQPLVRLVTDAQHVVLDAQVSDHLELLHLVNLPRTWMFLFSTAGFGYSGRFDQTAECLTLPSGLFGVLITMAFVRGVNLLASSSAERTQSLLDRLTLPRFFCVEPKKTTFSVILYYQK